MELLIVVSALGLLGVLANRYGSDSRSRLRSPEEHFAARGMTWETHELGAAPTPSGAPAHKHGVLARLSQHLRLSVPTALLRGPRSAFSRVRSLS
jgi:hypothetical protein